MPNLDHERAVQAHQNILEVNTLTVTDSDTIKKRYRSLVRSAGTLIHQAGLFQTLGFYFQKNEPHHNLLATHLLRRLFPNQPDGGDAGSLYLDHLLNCSDDQARWHTAETQAFILWLKRFAEGILPEPDSEDD